MTIHPAHLSIALVCVLLQLTALSKAYISLHRISHADVKFSKLRAVL